MDSMTPGRKLVLGIQMLFVAFGALVLVPLLTGLDPSVALFTAGAGTLLFHAITGGSVPIFLASSFAFIAPIQFAMKQFGPGATCGALFCAGLVYLLFSAMARVGGRELLNRYLPPIVTGPVIMVIGLKLAPVAVGMTRSFDGSTPDGRAIFLAACALLTAVAAVMYGRKLLSLIPVLCGIVVGYLVALAMGAGLAGGRRRVPGFLRGKRGVGCQLHYRRCANAGKGGGSGDLQKFSSRLIH